MGAPRACSCSLREPLPTVPRIQKLPLGRVLVCSLVLPARTAMFCQLPGWQLSSSCSRRPEQGARRRPLKSLSGLAALSSGLPPRNPTASDGQAPQNSEKRDHLSRKHAARLSPAGSHYTQFLGAGTMAFCKLTWVLGCKRGAQRSQGARPSPSPSSPP